MCVCVGEWCVVCVVGRSWSTTSRALEDALRVAVFFGSSSSCTGLSARLLQVVTVGLAPQHTPLLGAQLLTNYQS